MYKLSKAKFSRFDRKRGDKTHIFRTLLVLEVIRLAMNSEVQISDAWFNAIDKGTLQPDQKLKSLDLLILFQLYDLPNKRKSVESLFKNKIRSGKVTEELVRNCFKVCKYLSIYDLSIGSTETKYIRPNTKTQFF